VGTARRLITNSIIAPPWHTLRRGFSFAALNPITKSRATTHSMNRLAGIPILPYRTGPAQGCAVPPILPGAKNAHARRFMNSRPAKSAPPRPAPRHPQGVLDPAQFALTRVSCLSDRKDRTMITLYDHIQQLRAELRGCYFTRRERAAVKAELANALAEQAELDRAFDIALSALDSAEDTRAA
jgi:hypothetical protein